MRVPLWGSSPRVRGSLANHMLTLGDNGIIPAGAGLTARKNSSRCPTGDHPRGCGAHNIELQSTSYFPGSSPRVRGSRRCPCHRQVRARIIPAGAGLTCVSSLQRLPGRDHPRGCGAHALSLSTSKKHSGSSPRVRGSRSGLTKELFITRIIPAGAGLTQVETHLNPKNRDHPRGCGAHSTNSRLT